MKKTPVIAVALFGLCAVAALGADAGLMRIIGPVRLAAEPGGPLAGQVSDTRQILEKFQKGGFGQAIWAVDRLPAKDQDIKPWVGACLKAFPGEVIVALDTKLENGAVSPDPARLKLFLGALLQPSPTLNRELGTVNSLMINYTRMDNWECVTNEAAAIAQARANAELVRSVAPKAFLWLLMDDDPKSAGRMDTWVKGFGDSVSGYVLYREHGLKIMSEQSPAVASLIAQGKPVIRGGFAYISPRVRPGIEQDLKEQYQERISRYEKWLRDGRYVGYWRLVGEAVPVSMNINMNFMPN